MKAGIYHLIIKFPGKKVIKVGRLGAFLFPKGFYVYTGSAQVGLGKRVARHLSQEKKLHWHIDYLLQFGEIVDVLTIHGAKNRECVLSNQIALSLGGRVIAEKFGSSDCKCRTHLYFFEHTPEIKNLLRGAKKYRTVKKEDFTGC
ncbi:MAG: GIY-YIG nuclease family protein [Candidatus Scalindua sp.]|nr:GIY-YIG nuclease family protein [Candidatus Scalindua sp.]